MWIACWLAVAAAESLPHEPTPEMLAWVGELSDNGSVDERAARLLAALEARRPLAYVASPTRTAAEAFESGQVNCLAFSHLFVGLARELGIDAYYVRLDGVRAYDRDGNLSFVSTHVSPGFGPEANLRVIDPWLGPAEPRAVTRLTDTEAYALHLVNVGVGRLLDGEPAQAASHFSQAVTLDPTLAEGWVDLGVAFRRLDRFDDAEHAYRTALALDDGLASAWIDLAALYDLRGQTAESSELYQRLARSRHANPYTWLTLADAAMVRSDQVASGRAYRRARWLARDDAAVWAASAEWAAATGQVDRAGGMLARATRLDPLDPRVQRATARLGR